MFKLVSIDNSYRKILAHSMSINGKKLNKGKIIEKSDIKLLDNIWKKKIYIFEKTPNHIGENKASIQISKHIIGKNITINNPVNGRADLFSKINGLLDYDSKLLFKLNFSNTIRTGILTTVAILSSNISFSQDFGADLVSSYVWRGTQFGSGAHIQPYMTLGSGNLEAGVWGSFPTTANGGGNELDAYLSQNWSTTKETTYSSLGEVPTQNYTRGVNSPVNGLIMPSGSNNSIVIGIKNDNNVNARPQSGPQNADAVFEVLVEGGMTRFINIFYQSDTNYHGPIRSARPTDPTVLRPIGGVLVASGATGGLIPEIVDMGVPVITDRRPDYFRINSRKAPHNLYADTNKLKSTAISRGYRKTNTPQPLFPWGEPSFNNWKTNSYLTLTFSGYTETTWTWNGSNYVRTYYDAYKNQKNDNVHYWSDINGNTGQIAFKTVIALFCEPYVHPLQLPSVKTVGEGRAIILHGGKMLDAKWKRGSNLDPFHIVDSNNNILYVPKGKVWISLVPNTKNPSFG